MARQVNKLTVREVAALKEPGMHADGAGLYLRVDQTLNKRWVFVFFTNKKRREMGLGSASAVDLKAARDAADAARKLVKEGKDPIADRQAEVTAATTFEDVAKKAIAVQAEGWRGGKDGPTAEQWLSSLETHCGRSPSPRSAPKTWSALSSRSGRLSRKPRRACAPASNMCSTSPGWTNFERERIRRAGKVT
jgi:hypothetical protein